MPIINSVQVLKDVNQSLRYPADEHFLSSDKMKRMKWNGTPHAPASRLAPCVLIFCRWTDARQKNAHERRALFSRYTCLQASSDNVIKNDKRIYRTDLDADNGTIWTQLGQYVTVGMLDSVVRRLRLKPRFLYEKWLIIFLWKAISVQKI